MTTISMLSLLLLVTIATVQGQPGYGDRSFHRLPWPDRHNQAGYPEMKAPSGYAEMRGPPAYKDSYGQSHRMPGPNVRPGYPFYHLPGRNTEEIPPITLPLMANDPLEAQENEKCSCEQQVNRQLTASLDSCVKATSSLLNCQTTSSEARRVVQEAMIQESSCECAKKVSSALTDSLKYCVEAVEEFEECESAPPSPPGPPPPAPPESPAGPPSEPAPPSEPQPAPPPGPTPPAPRPPPPARFNQALDDSKMKEGDMLPDATHTRYSSCDDIKMKNPRSPSGYYTIVDNEGMESIVYCRMHHRG